MDPLLGTMAGNYRLVARLGSGGMGEVYKGVNEKIGSKVAIKLLHASSDEARFMREAQAVNRIDHPGIVKVLDTGRTARGRSFLVMELLDGDSLHAIVKAGRPPLAEACGIIADVLDALAAAHAAGVVHRDLKPPNIFRTRSGRIVVLDFGVAKLADSARLTITGTAIGTPHYMAPEQIRGEAVTAASDIYAAGVVLFELVCGRRPFEGTDDDSVFVGHLERRPPPPRALEPAISIALQDVILTALAKDPQRRFASAAAMRDALRATIGPVGPLGPRADYASPTKPTIDAPATKPTVDALLRTDPDRTPAAVIAHRARSRTRWFVAAAVAALVVCGAIAIAVGFAHRAAKPARAIDAAVAPAVIDATPAIDARELACGDLVTQMNGSVIASRCTLDHWRAQAIGCYASAQSSSEFDRCAETLNPEQRDSLSLALTDAEKQRDKESAWESPKPTPKPTPKKAKPKDAKPVDPFSPLKERKPTKTRPCNGCLERPD